MRGNLRYSRKERFRRDEIMDFIMWANRRYEAAHLLISDGILLDLRPMLDLSIHISVQRILNPHQLQRILVSGDCNPYFIAAVSEVTASWPMEIVQSIYEVMRIKAYSMGSMIFFFVFGGPWIYESFFSGYPEANGAFMEEEHG